MSELSDREKAEIGLDYLRAAQARSDAIRGLVETVDWYRENARLCRLIHSEGDVGRHALSEDGGKRAVAALATADAAGLIPHNLAKGGTELIETSLERAAGTAGTVPGKR